MCFGWGLLSKEKERVDVGKRDEEEKERGEKGREKNKAGGTPKVDGSVFLKRQERVEA